MKAATSVTLEAAAQLRREFDLSFAAQPSVRGDDREDLLAIRVGGQPHALLLRELAGLHADCAIVPVPSASSDLLGVASFRGVVVPIYDLRVLLGYPGGTPARWLVLSRAAPVRGFAFDQFEALLRLARSALVEGDGSAAGRGPIRGAVQADAARPLIDVAALLEKIRARA